MFKKKKSKKISPTNETDFSGRSIHFYTENGGQTPVDFHTPDVVAQFDIEEECQAFISHCDLDHYNGDFMDRLIDEKIEAGKEDLKRQHRKHLRTIYNLENNINCDLVVISQNLNILAEAKSKLEKQLSYLGEETI